MTVPIRFSPVLAAPILAAWVASQPAGAAVFNPETFTLSNGMQVVVIPNHRAPVVTQMVWYKVGAADEPAGKSGIAHMFEHLMFKATRRRASGEFSKIVARNGGRDNAFTSQDYTAYHQTVARDRLEIVMRLEADRMRGLLLKPDEIETERQVVLEERRSRTDNSPRARLSEQFNASLFLNHPYGKPVIGWAHEVKVITGKDLKEFYDKWYRPNNAILVVAGNITAKELRPLAIKHYELIPWGELPKRVRPSEPPHDAARRVVLRDASVRQPSWRRGYLAPTLGSGEKKHVYPLQVLAQILAGGATSRLNRGLVMDSKIAISAGGFYDGDSMGPGGFHLFASPRPGTTMEALEEAVEAIIAELVREGVTDDEVARAKRRMQSSANYIMDSSVGGARTLGAAQASGHVIADVESWPERIGAVTPNQIYAAARAIFQNKNSVTGILLPAAAKEGN
ncbi:MAG: pitrilysin family protein [Pseudomonadota bacterium]|nr:pitrilysin family protein [Pseudomonadota bacterium]